MGVNILETGFDGITRTVILAGGVLTNSVGKGVIGGRFFTRGHVEITKVDMVTIGVKGLGIYFF